MIKYKDLSIPLKIAVVVVYATLISFVGSFLLGLIAGIINKISG